jgi:hypothetical protein
MEYDMRTINITNIIVIAVALLPQIAGTKIIKSPLKTKQMPPTLCVLRHTYSEESVQGVRIPIKKLEGIFGSIFPSKMNINPRAY